MKKLLATLLSLIMVFCFITVIPVSAEGKEITLVWNDEGTDGAWYKLPGGVTANVGDTIVFPPQQFMVMTKDQSLEGVPINVTTKSDWSMWDNWGQPWSKEGKGYPITVVEGENAIYCMTIFGDGVNNIDGNYGSTDLEPQNLICLIRFNSGDTGSGKAGDSTSTDSTNDNNATDKETNTGSNFAPTFGEDGDLTPSTTTGIDDSNTDFGLSYEGLLILVTILAVVLFLVLCAFVVVVIILLKKKNK